jgi:flagellar hook-associated protein 1 FlgK
MADLFSALSTAARALDANRFALEVVGHNLANVNTAGYTRRSAVLGEVAPLDLAGAGSGVEVLGVEAARAPLIERRLYQERPAAGRERAVSEQLGIIEAGLGDAGHALDARLTEFFDAFAALAEDPTSNVARRIVTLQGTSLARAFQDLSSQFVGARLGADAEVRGTIETINSLAQEVASLNIAIVTATSGTEEALIDRRGNALRSLSELVDIGITYRDDGGIDVTVGNGRALVAGENAYGLTGVPASGVTSIRNGSLDITAELTGGRLGGYLEIRDVTVPSYASRLDALAYSFVETVNTQHAAGYDLSGDDGGDFFTPVGSAAGAAAAMSVSAAILADNSRIAASSSDTQTGDNQNARALAALRNANPSAIDDWGVLVHRVAADRPNSLAELETREDVLAQIESLRSQISGVSIDEEAATMLRFQRAYEANARFFGVVDGLLEEMLSFMGR